jgi:hypothetical protein
MTVGVPGGGVGAEGGVAGGVGVGGRVGVAAGVAPGVVGGTGEDGAVAGVGDGGGLADQPVAASGKASDSSRAVLFTTVGTTAPERPTHVRTV